MSRSNLNIKELEKKFDELLNSFSDAEVEAWYRFDKMQEQLELFYSGEFQPVQISECTLSTSEKEIVYLQEIEVFDYTVDVAC